MKIGLLTIHVGHNFGSNLQTIASCRILKELGGDPFVINYIPSRVSPKTYWKEAMESPIRFVRRCIAAPNFYSNIRIYESFLNKHCIVSSPLYDENNFVQKCPKADVYVAGSDQIWNSHHNRGFNDRYFFAGFPDSTRKISLSSSFGVESLPEDEFVKVKDLLAQFEAISVREKSAQQLVASMGLNSTQLLDPTLMLDRFQWQEYMSKRIIKENYLLMYAPYNIKDKKQLYEAARVIAQAKGLKVVTFSFDFRGEPHVDKTIKYANPGEFLSLMHYADYVITNSFHGTAFSINLNKQFWTFLPSGFGTRIRSIIELCGLNDRIKSSTLSVEDLQQSIDYTSVNAILDKEREKAK